MLITERSHGDTQYPFLLQCSTSLVFGTSMSQRLFKDSHTLIWIGTISFHSITFYSSGLDSGSVVSFGVLSLWQLCGLLGMRSLWEWASWMERRNDYGNRLDLKKNITMSWILHR